MQLIFIFNTFIFLSFFGRQKNWVMSEMGWNDVFSTTNPRPSPHMFGEGHCGLNFYRNCNCKGSTASRDALAAICGGFGGRLAKPCAHTHVHVSCVLATRGRWCWTLKVQMAIRWCPGIQPCGTSIVSDMYTYETNLWRVAKRLVEFFFLFRVNTTTYGVEHRLYISWTPSSAPWIVHVHT